MSMRWLGFYSGLARHAYRVVGNNIVPYVLLFVTSQCVCFFTILFNNKRPRLDFERGGGASTRYSLNNSHTHSIRT